MVQKTFIKDPDAFLDYQIDWTAWLSGDTIVSSSWIGPDEIVRVSDSYSSTAATIWLSGGSAGRSYDLTNRILTAGSRIDERTIEIKVKEL